MKPAAAEKQVSVEIGPGNGSQVIRGDREALEQAFTNIISNAIIYNRPDGRVQLGIRENGASLIAEISDSGLGIPEKDIPLIFDQFYRSRNDQTRCIKGTGLGLPIAKKIVESHQGSLEVDSVINEGSTFTVLLPKTAN